MCVVRCLSECDAAKEGVPHSPVPMYFNLIDPHYLNLGPSPNQLSGKSHLLFIIGDNFRKNCTFEMVNSGEHLRIV